MKHLRDDVMPFQPDLDRRIASEPKNIPGWGIDADPDNDPTYPMKHWNGADHERLNYNKPAQQPIDVEILHSNERPTVTAVFGTTVPPSGLSGKIRRYAFQHSESTYSHWVPLVLADRINMYEAFIDDLKNGIFPNIIAERGWTAEWKYNRQGLLQTAALGVVLLSAIILFSSAGKRKHA
jgi:hypothetical protein